MAGEAPALGEPPETMPVHVDHDGVDWTSSYGLDVQKSVAFLVAVAVGVGLSVLTPLWMAIPGVLGCVALVATVLRRPRELVVLRPDRVWIGSPPDRVEILLDALTEVRVVSSDARRSCLVLGCREGRYPVGLGAPDDHLRWMAAAIERAQHHDRRTDAAEGSEIFTHRVTPEAFVQGPTEAETPRRRPVSERRQRE